MAQIYVNSGLVKPKSIHIYNSSAQLWEEDKVGYVRISGEWVPFISYRNDIYVEGQEFVPFVQGYIYSAGTIYREDDHILINGTVRDGHSSSKNTIVTDVMVDLTGYHTLVVDWSGYGGGAGYAYHHTMITRQKNISNSAEAIALKTISSTTFNRRIDKIDVSSLSGVYYIAIQVDVRGESMGANTLLHEMYLE